MHIPTMINDEATSENSHEQAKTASIAGEPPFSFRQQKNSDPETGIWMPTQEEQTLIEDLVSKKIYDSKEHLFREGEKVDFAFRMIQGLACIYTILPKGQRVIIGFLAPGAVFGIETQTSYPFSGQALK